jgi:hypothetical protein
VSVGALEVARDAGCQRLEVQVPDLSFSVATAQLWPATTSQLHELAISYVDMGLMCRA